MPKICHYVKEWEIMSIGLHPDFVNSVEKADYFMMKTDMERIIKETQEV